MGASIVRKAIVLQRTDNAETESCVSINSESISVMDGPEEQGSLASAEERGFKSLSGYAAVEKPSDAFICIDSRIVGKCGSLSWIGLVKVIVLRHWPIADGEPRFHDNLVGRSLTKNFHANVNHGPTFIRKPDELLRDVNRHIRSKLTLFRVSCDAGLPTRENCGGYGTNGRYECRYKCPVLKPMLLFFGGLFAVFCGRWMLFFSKCTRNFRSWMIRIAFIPTGFASAVGGGIHWLVIAF